MTFFVRLLYEFGFLKRTNDGFIKIVSECNGCSDAEGLNSESWYNDWLRSGDQSIRSKILEYNEDDVIAMEVIDMKLSELFDK